MAPYLYSVLLFYYLKNNNAYNLDESSATLDILYELVDELVVDNTEIR